MKKKMVSVLLTASMLAGMTLCAVPVMAEDAETPENEVTGDASAEDSFVVWGWNDDIKKILDGPFKEAYPDDYERIVFVNTGGSDYFGYAAAVLRHLRGFGQGNLDLGGCGKRRD